MDEKSTKVCSSILGWLSSTGGAQEPGVRWRLCCCRCSVVAVAGCLRRCGCCGGGGGGSLLVLVACVLLLLLLLIGREEIDRTHSK
jgi:hypothetical protein